MSAAVLFVILWLATYRVTRLFVADSVLDGPRERLFARWPPDDDYAADNRRPVSKLGQLFNCWFCIGFWLSGAVVVVSVQYVSVPLPVLWWWAVSGAVGLTGKNLDA